MAAPLNERDFAIVIGISCYPDFEGLPDLTASEPDSDAVAAWLKAPDRGALPHNNLTVLHSPTRQVAEEAFNHMFERFHDDTGRRLYIFGSGYGFANEPDSAALLMADASPERLDNSIDLTAYADAIYYSGLFSEVVLFADFAHKTMLRGIPTKPRWKIPRAPREGDARFYGFSALSGAVAYPVSEPDERGALSLFSRLVLDGLYGSAADDTGRIDSSMLQRFIERRLVELTDETNAPVMRPKFLSEGVRPIVFVGDDASSTASNVFEYVSNLVFDQAGLAGSQATEAAQHLLSAAVELLPQKRTKQDTLSSTQLFMAAITWGNLSNSPVDAPEPVRNLADEVMTNGDGYDRLQADYFEEVPPRLSFRLDRDSIESFSLSETLQQAFKEMLLPPEQITESHLLGATLRFMDTDEGKKSRFWARLQDMSLDPQALHAAMTRKPPTKADDAVNDLRRGYTNDGINAANPEADKLNVNAQARLFAELIMNPQVKPPLSIGLFGNWGSGKSFFMDRMGAEIDSLNGQSGRISRVMQVKFNAWHFVDANLWASLATKILDDVANEIATELGEEPSPEDLERKRATLRKEIESSRRHKSEAGQELETAIAERATAKADYEKQRGKRLRAALELGQTRWQHLEELAEENPDLKAALEGTKQVASQLGVDDALASADGLEKLLSDARAASHSISSLGRTLMADIRRPAGLLVSLILPAGIVALLAFGAVGLAEWRGVDVTEQWQVWRNRLATWIAPLTGSLFWLRTRLRSIAKGAEHVEALIKGTGDLELADTAELQEIDKAVHNAQTKMREAERRQAEYEHELQRIDAGGLVYDFLESRRNNEAYLKYKGLISIVRDDFENLQTAMRTLQGTRPIDRIVLYIDDLDRCRPTRVVEVLEAIHMLLSFELFCVVVAVDSRWLRTSLERSYRSLTGVGDSFQVGGQPFTAQNYLEKIFQIPFSLPHMDRTGFANLVDAVLEPPASEDDKQDDDARSLDGNLGGNADGEESSDEGQAPEDNSHYQGEKSPPGASHQQGQSGSETTNHERPTSLRGLFSHFKNWLKTRLSASENSPATAEDTTAEATQESGADEESPAEPTATPSEEDNPTPLQADDPETAFETITLGDHERLFIHTLHEFIKTPRQAKRFVNIYRLLRPRPGTPELEAFAGSPGDAGYKCMLLMLAINTGYPALGGRLLRALANCPIATKPGEKEPKTWNEFLEAINSSEKAPQPWAQIWTNFKDVGRDVAEELFERLRDFDTRLDQQESLDITFKLPNNLDEYKRFARQVGRYSFDWNMALPGEVEGETVAGKSDDNSRPATGP